MPPSPIRKFSTSWKPISSNEETKIRTETQKYNMNKLITGLATFAATCTAASAVNVIVNGSFENTTVGSADNWTNASTADSAPLLAQDGTLRTFTGDDTTIISQQTGTVALTDDILTLDFWGNSSIAGRGWVGTIILDGGSGGRVVLDSITLNMDASAAAWDQANAASSTYTVTAADLATAGAGATYGVEFVGTTGSGFKGLDSVSLDVTSVPEPSSTTLLGLGGLALILRRRK